MITNIPLIKALFSRFKSIPEGYYLLDYEEIDHSFTMAKVYFTNKVPRSKKSNDGSYYMTFISRRNDIFEMLYGIWFILEYYDISKYMRKNGITMEFDDVYQIKVDHVFDMDGSVVSSGGIGILVKKMYFVNAKKFKKGYEEDESKPVKVKAEGSVKKLSIVRGYDLDYLVSAYQLYPKTDILISSYDKYFVLK